MIKSVVFDLDDTLYRQEEPFLLAVHKIFPQFSECSNKFFKTFRFFSEYYYERMMKEKKITAKEANYLRMEKTLELLYGFQVSETEIEEFEKEYERQIDSMCMDEHLRSVLSLLSKKYQLGIITNGLTKRQQLKLEALQLDKIIPSENMLISETIGIAKPDRRIFDQMAQQLDCEPEELLYVGDSFQNDVVGAKNAGWRVWWFNHQHQTLSELTEKVYDKELRFFHELAEELSTL